MPGRHASADEAYFLESFNGKKHGMTRKSHQRGVWRSARGLSDERIPVLIFREMYRQHILFRFGESRQVAYRCCVYATAERVMRFSAPTAAGHWCEQRSECTGKRPPLAMSHSCSGEIFPGRGYKRRQRSSTGVLEYLSGGGGGFPC